MSLKEYAKSARFDKTPEPKPVPTATPSPGNFFCVQRHDASRLHIRFPARKWTVLSNHGGPEGTQPRAPLQDLAVHVEDTRSTTAISIGTIPKGEYGGGSVML